MKPKSFLFMAAASLLMVAASCEQDSEEQTNNENVNCFTRCEPIGLTHEKFCEYAKGKTHVRRACFECTDSLEQICVWGQDGSCAIGKPLKDLIGTQFSYYFGYYGVSNPVCKFDTEAELEYRFTTNTGYPDSVVTCKHYWHYDEKTNVVVTSVKPITDEYLSNWEEPVGWAKSPIVFYMDEQFIVVKFEITPFTPPYEQSKTYWMEVYEAVKDETIENPKYKISDGIPMCSEAVWAF